VYWIFAVMNLFISWCLTGICFLLDYFASLSLSHPLTSLPLARSPIFFILLSLSLSLPLARSLSLAVSVSRFVSLCLSLTLTVDVALSASMPHDGRGKQAPSTNISTQTHTRGSPDTRRRSYESSVPTAASFSYSLSDPFERAQKVNKDARASSVSALTALTRTQPHTHIHTHKCTHTSTKTYTKTYIPIKNSIKTHTYHKHA